MSVCISYPWEVFLHMGPALRVFPAFGDAFPCDIGGFSIVLTNTCPSRCSFKGRCPSAGVVSPSGRKGQTFLVQLHGFKLSAPMR
jgi:hypothetical protein